MSDSSNLIWLDLEMTGLDATKDVILELALIPTDKDLHILDQGIDIVIHQKESMLNSMEPKIKTMHEKSGLTDKVRHSRISETEAEEQALKYAKQYTTSQASPLCGSSIYYDRYFLMSHLPRLNEFFHYRNIDVSTIKELVKRWYPDLVPFTGKDKHEAISDIIDSIEQLKFYRENIFINAR